MTVVGSWNNMRGKLQLHFSKYADDMVLKCGCAGKLLKALNTILGTGLFSLLALEKERFFYLLPLTLIVVTPGKCS